MSDEAYRACRSFVAALQGAGVEVVAVCSGSRSTGMALAFHDDGRFDVYSHIDERSASFFALGAARATGKPAAVVTTSGTAAANLLPACAEARAAGVPLLLLTADRPLELHDVGAVQTIEQVGLLPPARWFADLHTEDEVSPSYSANLGAQGAAFAVGPPAGPVHINVRFREPLVPSKEARAEPSAAIELRRDVGLAPPPSDAVEDLAGRIAERPRGLIHVGHVEGAREDLAAGVASLATASGYPVIAEATSRLRGLLSGAVVVDAAEMLVPPPMFTMDGPPDMVIRIGMSPLTRRVSDWLEDPARDVVVISPELPWPDPRRAARTVLAAEPALACAALAEAVGSRNAAHDPEWAGEWARASASARRALDEHLADAPLFEGTVVRELLEAMPDAGLVYVGTSLPIRALDLFAPANRRLDAFANRGASGIDGTISAAAGAAAATGRPTVCLAGDLAFLHDAGGLLSVARHGIPLVTVVIDNGGGGIFEFLPQAEAVERDTFEDLFVAAHEFDASRMAEAVGVGAATVEDAPTLAKALSTAFDEGGPWVIRVPVDRAASVRAHRTAWERVRKAR